MASRPCRRGRDATARSHRHGQQRERLRARVRSAARTAPWSAHTGDRRTAARRPRRVAAACACSATSSATSPVGTPRAGRSSTARRRSSSSSRGCCRWPAEPDLRPPVALPTPRTRCPPPPGVIADRHRWPSPAASRRSMRCPHDVPHGRGGVHAALVGPLVQEVDAPTTSSAGCATCRRRGHGRHAAAAAAADDHPGDPLDTHPPTKERIARITAVLRQTASRRTTTGAPRRCSAIRSAGDDGDGGVPAVWRPCPEPQPVPWSAWPDLVVASATRSQSADSMPHSAARLPPASRCACRRRHRAT